MRICDKCNKRIKENNCEELFGEFEKLFDSKEKNPDNHDFCKTCKKELNGIISNWIKQK